MEIVLDIALVRMPAGKADPCISQRAEPAAVLAGGAFYGLFFVFYYYVVPFLVSNSFRFSICLWVKMLKLSSR